MKLDEETPDRTFFCRVREALGTRRIRQAFMNIMQKAEEKGVVRNVFTFVDATAIKTKETTWAERDKAYCLKPARDAMDARGCHSGAVLKNNMKVKNFDKDRWLTKIRAPFENVFSKLEKRARYRETVKVQMQAFLEAMVFNVKRLVAINAPPLFAAC